MDLDLDLRLARMRCPLMCGWLRCVDNNCSSASLSLYVDRDRAGLCDDTSAAGTVL